MRASAVAPRLPGVLGYPGDPGYLGYLGYLGEPSGARTLQLWVSKHRVITILIQ